MDKFSFCESVYAGPRTPWHVRKLTSQGRKLGGGADTAALCGQEVSWDLQVPICQHHLTTHTCSRCVTKYEEEAKRGNKTEDVEA